MAAGHQLKCVIFYNTHVLLHVLFTSLDINVTPCKGYSVLHSEANSNQPTAPVPKNWDILSNDKRTFNPTVLNTGKRDSFR